MSPATPQYPDRLPMRTITIEEHYTIPKLAQNGTPRRDEAARNAILEQLCDLGLDRITAMDAAGIDVQVISANTPGVGQFDADQAIPLARELNDVLAEAIRRYPDRFAGFASLPTAAPTVAADELERTVKEYGFKGAIINGHTQGRYLDDEFFWPMLERAEALQVPIYLHPTPPPQTIVDAYYTGNFSPGVTALLSTSGWGWHIETAVHVLRIILSGVFDRYPDLQVVIGHMGEALPFMMSRIEWSLTSEVTKLKRPIRAYFRENIHYTFGGFNWTPTFLDLLLQVGVERIMFSIDHPYQPMEKARAFLDNLPVSPADKERIAHGNAERLLRM
jgi:uncharacterized protein